MLLIFKMGNYTSNIHDILAEFSLSIVVDIIPALISF